MGEQMLKAMMIIALGMVAGAGLAGAVVGGLAGAVVGKAAGVTVVITAPIGAALGAAATGTATYRRIWYGNNKRDNDPHVDGQA